MTSSPTSRSLAWARKQGWRAGVVEKWNPHAKVRHDLFGVFDLIVLLRIGTPSDYVTVLVGVQACAGASHAARRDKVRAAPALADWCRAGAVAEVWSWAKQGKAGKRKLWTLRREEVRPCGV